MKVPVGSIKKLVSIISLLQRKVKKYLLYCYILKPFYRKHTYLLQFNNIFINSLQIIFETSKKIYIAFPRIFQIYTSIFQNFIQIFIVIYLVKFKSSLQLSPRIAVNNI